MNNTFFQGPPSRFEGPSVSFIFAVIVLALFAVLLFVALTPGLTGGGNTGSSWNYSRTLQKGK